MKKLIFVVYCIFLTNLFATDGEFFLRINGISSSTNWTLTVEKIPGQYYYDENFDIVEPPDLIFSRMGFAKIQADFIFDVNNNGTFDDNNNQFDLYYGIYKLTLNDGNISTFYLNYLDCDYVASGEHYSGADVFFDFQNGASQEWRRTNVKGGNTVRYYSEGSYFNIWQDILKISNLDQIVECFKADVTVRNILDNQDYGILSVNGANNNSGDIVPLSPGSIYTFETYHDFQNINYLFRDWNYLNSEYFNNPDYFLIEEDQTVAAYLYPTLPLTVTNNLEGGSGGTWQVKWDKMNDYESPINSESSHDAFKWKQDLDDTYTLEVEQVISPLLGTEWHFHEWQDKPNKPRTRSEAISDDNYQFTANYKGQFRSNSAEAFSSNSQRKLVRTDDGNAIIALSKSNGASSKFIKRTASGSYSVNNTNQKTFVPFVRFVLKNKSINPLKHIDFLFDSFLHKPDLCTCQT